VQENKQRIDYDVYAEQCQQKEQSFSKQVLAISKELIAQAPTVWSLEEASKRLHKISERHMVIKAVSDTSINAKVFGVEAAGHIYIARQAIIEGNQQRQDLSE
jgi:hypothetical protein